MTTPTKNVGTGMGAIFLVLFLDLVGFSIVFPLYAHLFDHYATSGLLAAGMAWAERIVPVADHGQRTALFGGLLGAGYSLLQVVAAPWWGRLSDRIGRRRVLLASIAGNSVAYLIWIFADDFAIFLLSRLVAGVMTGNTAVANAAVADISTPATRSRAMGLVGMAFGLGFLVGPLIGGLAYEVLPRLDHIAALRTMGANPFSTAALIAFVLSIINLLWAGLRFRETLPAVRRVIPPSRPATGRFAFLGRDLGATARTVNLAFTLHILLFSGMEATLVFIAWDRCGFSVGDTTWLFLCMGVVSALIQGVVFRRLPAETDQRVVAMIGLLALLPGYVAIALVDWSPHAWWLFIGISLLAIGTGLVFPSFSTLASLHTGASAQGRAMGALRAAGALGRAAGPLLAGLLYFLWRPSAPYLTAAAAVLIPLLLIRRLGR
jgi:MFS family permease